MRRLIEAPSGRIVREAKLKNNYSTCETDSPVLQCFYVQSEYISMLSHLTLSLQNFGNAQFRCEVNISCYRLQIK